jgi:hypothetical protein
MERQQQSKQIAENVGIRNGVPQFFQQRFEMLLGRLLAEKTELVMQRFSSPTELDGEPIIGVGLA